MMRAWLLLCVFVLACRRDDRVSSVQHGKQHVFTVNVRYEVPECGVGYDIERLDDGAWKPAGVWYKVFKDCYRWVDEGPSPNKDEYCRCEPRRGPKEKGDYRDPPFDITWGGDLTTGPAPPGKYRLVIAGATHEFDHR